MKSFRKFFSWIQGLADAEYKFRYLVLVLIIAFFAVLKLNFNPGLGRPCLDGDYYYQIARNVSDGNGFTTNLSLYNQGLNSFPHKINHSPLWPLVMGYLGKIFDLEDVAGILPEVCFLSVLILLYFFTNRLWERVGEPKDEKHFFLNNRFVDIGHIVVILFGANSIFFEFTSMPYTEGLGFVFLLCALISAHTAAERGSIPFSALAGFFSALGFLTRTQMVGIVLVVPFVFIIVGLRHRRFLLLGVASALAVAFTIAPWVAWVASWADVSGWQTFSGMGTIHETPGLSLFRQTVAASSYEVKLNQIIEGFKVAFSPVDKDSYYTSFGAVIYTVPVAVLAVLGGWRELKRAIKSIVSPNGCIVFMTILSTLVMLAPLHMEKRQFFKTWLFGWRHGLPLIMLVVVALIYLFQRADKLGRAISVVLVVATMMHSFGTMSALFKKKYSPGLDGPEVPLVAWLDSQDPRPAVVTTHSQILSAFSRSYFHWIDCRVSARHTRALLENGSADYVLVYPRHSRCNYFSPLRDEMELIKKFTRRWTIEVWKPKETMQKKRYLRPKSNEVGE